MSEKSKTDTSVDNFRERFPTTEDFVNWMLAQPPRPRKTNADFFAAVIEQRKLRDAQDPVTTPPAPAPEMP